MCFDRRRGAAALLRLFVALGAGLAAMSHAYAQTEPYPSRTIRVVVPANPGASPDLLARIIARHLAPRLGQQVVVVNQPGGGGNIGHGTAAKAVPDGYTLLVTSDARTAEAVEATMERIWRKIVTRAISSFSTQ